MKNINFWDVYYKAYNYAMKNNREIVLALDNIKMLVKIPNDDVIANKKWIKQFENKDVLLVVERGGVKVMGTDMNIQTPYNNATLLNCSELQAIVSSKSASSYANKFAKQMLANNITKECFDEIFNGDESVSSLLQHIEKFTSVKNPILEEIKTGEISSETIVALEDINQVLGLLTRYNDLEETLLKLPFAITAQVNPEKIFLENFLNIKINSLIKEEPKLTKDTLLETLSSAFTEKIKAEGYELKAIPRDFNTFYNNKYKIPVPPTKKYYDDVVVKMKREVYEEVAPPTEIQSDSIDISKFHKVETIDHAKSFKLFSSEKNVTGKNINYDVEFIYDMDDKIAYSTDFFYLNKENTKIICTL